VSGWRLAHLNVVKPTTELSPDNENLRYFLSKLPEVFAAAAEDPEMAMHTHAFRTEAGDYIQLEDFESLLPTLKQPHVMTMAVWRSIDSLMKFAYRGSVHGRAMRPLKDWVNRDEGPTLVLWWIAADDRVTPESAWERLEALRRDGPTEYAFDLRNRFPAPGD
jgi:hypothetical protein